MKRQNHQTMKAAATAIGAPLAVIQKARALGCDAFKHGRVHVEKLREWLARPENGAAQTAGTERDRLELEKLRRQCAVLATDEETRKVNLAKARGELVSASEVTADVRAITEEIKATLQRELVTELPVVNEGLSAEKQRENNRAAFARVMARWQKWAETRDSEKPETKSKP
jgi:hypothetical protein